MNKKDLKVGQKIYLEAYSSAQRYHKENIIESTITKVGKKYFEIDEYGKFLIENLKNEDEVTGNINYIAYLSKKEIEEKSIKGTLITKFFKIFSSLSNFNNLTLDQLKKIDEIIENKNN